MAHAYKCNWCKKYYDGMPRKSLSWIDRESGAYPGPEKVFHLCEDCFKIFLSLVEIKKEKK